MYLETRDERSAGTVQTAEFVWVEATNRDLRRGVDGDAGKGGTWEALSGAGIMFMELVFVVV